MEEGHAMGYFRLYKNLGIFQNEEQIQNYKSKDGKVINLMPFRVTLYGKIQITMGRLQMKIEPIVAILGQNGHSV